MKSSPVTAALLSAVRQLIKTLTALNVRLIPYGQVRLAVKIHVDAENLPRTPELVRFTALSPRQRTISSRESRLERAICYDIPIPLIHVVRTS